MTEAGKSRFEAPKASVFLNSKGQLSLGLPEKPIFRPQRNAFEATKAEESRKAEEQAAINVQNKSRLFNIYTAHMDEERRLRGTLAREARRIARFHYGPSLQTSKDNPLQSGFDDTPQQPPRPIRARTPQEDPNANEKTSLQMNCMPASPTKGLRFAGRTMFATQHLHDRDEQAVKSPTRQAQEAASNRLRQELRLMQDYPHGLPASKLREAREKGMRIGGLGYGNDGKSAILNG